MKIVFDENVPWPLRKLLSDFSVTNVQREGLGGTENGELLATLDGRFDVFILCDKNLRYQQNLKGKQIAIIELPTNRWPILKNLQEVILSALSNTVPGGYVTIEEQREGEQDVTPNASPASCSSRHDRYNLNPVFNPRP
jgi:hypothetical protein